MEPPDHSDGQAALATESFGDAGPGPDHGLEILPTQPLLLHPEQNGVNRVRWVDRNVSRDVPVCQDGPGRAGVDCG